MGERSIHYMGHVRMMAAVQPFISGAISKTVNMPEEVTVEEVEHLFVEGWKLGLKAVAIYRDNCKVAQPLSADKKAKDRAEVPTQLAQPVRKRLPRSRPSITTKFEVGDAEGYITASSYPDDGIGEIFLKTSKQGSTLAGVMDAFSIAISIGLQYGVPLEAYVSKFINMKFEPSGMTNDPDIRFASSLVDYVFRRLALDHLPRDTRQELGIRSIAERKETVAQDVAAKMADELGEAADVLSDPPVDDPLDASPTRIELVERPKTQAADAPLCYTCGSKMQPAGSCYVCPSCGSTSGCS
jgi:ribonucleoside-diphosphate reductase alpha chain